MQSPVHSDLNREEVLSPSGWLSDRVIEAAQLFILQQFPHISGLQNRCCTVAILANLERRSVMTLIVRKAVWNSDLYHSCSFTCYR